MNAFFTSSTARPDEAGSFIDGAFLVRRLFGSITVLTNRRRQLALRRPAAVRVHDLDVGPAPSSWSCGRMGDHRQNYHPHGVQRVTAGERVRCGVLRRHALEPAGPRTVGVGGSGSDVEERTPRRPSLRPPGWGTALRSTCCLLALISGKHPARRALNTEGGSPGCRFRHPRIRVNEDAASFPPRPLPARKRRRPPVADGVRRHAAADASTVPGAATADGQGSARTRPTHAEARPPGRPRASRRAAAPGSGRLPAVDGGAAANSNTAPGAPRPGLGAGGQPVPAPVSAPGP